MKTILITLIFSIAFTPLMFGQDTFELEPSQSMLMTGKCPGQDGAINPYSGQDSIAVVENMGNDEFEVRIQKNGRIVDIIQIKSNTTKEIKLLKGQELYIDSKTGASTKLNFKPIE